ncbi:MAG: nucleotide sugar dehydrogenase [Nitrososphaeria archaeon]
MLYSSVCVFGLGYVGLPTAVVFASRGFNVVGIDVDESKVAAINRGLSYLTEPGLGELLASVVSKGKLRATTVAEDALEFCDVILIDVPTPIKAGIVDLSYIANVSESIAKKLHKDMLVVVESTVPPGTTNGLVRRMLEGRSGLKSDEDFYLAHAPERIAPGRAIEELLHTPRVVGGVGPRSTERASEVYRRVSSKLLLTDATTAEFVKLAENAFRDLNIAFANLLALMAERIGVDVYEAIRIANTHPRVTIHWPGTGVGGPCLTKDPYMLASLIDHWGVELIRLGRRINEYMPYHFVGLIEKVAGLEGFQLRSAKVAVLGVAYKSGVDDVRETPARVVVSELLERGARVVVHDPYVRESFGAMYSDSLEEAVKEADVVAIVTDHPEFRKIDLQRLAALVRRKIIVDGRRVFEPQQALSSGFRYYGIGYGIPWRVQA